MVLKPKIPLTAMYCCLFFFPGIFAGNKEPWLKNEIQQLKNNYFKNH